MTLRAKSKKTLIPDVPANKSNPSSVIAGLGVFCASVVLIALLFVFLGA
jgi:hypothetical protein